MDGRPDSKFTWYILGGCKFTDDRELETITNYSQQDATSLEFISTDALHVSCGSSAHHQEHVTVHTASGIVNHCCC